MIGLDETYGAAVKRKSTRRATAPGGKAMRRALLALAFLAGTVLGFKLMHIATALLFMFLVSGVLCWNTRHSKPVALQAANQAALTLVFGVGGVLLLLAFLNFVPEANSQNVVSQVQGHLLCFDDLMKTYTKMSIGRSLAVLAGLALLSRWLPSWRLVSRWARVNSIVGRAATVLGIMSSFTFTTSLAAAVVSTHADVQITARYQAAKDRMKQNAQCYIAAATVDAAMSNLPATTLADYRALFLAGQSFAETTAATLLDYLDQWHWNKEEGVVESVAAKEARVDLADIKLVHPDVGLHLPPSVSGIPRHASYSEKIKALRAEEASADEVELKATQSIEAAREAFSSALDAGSSPLEEWTKDFVDGLVGQIAASITFVPDEYISSLLDAYKDSFVNANMNLVRRAMSAELWKTARHNAVQLAAKLRANLQAIFEQAMDDENDTAKELAASSLDHSREGNSKLATSELKQAKDDLEIAHVEAHLQEAVSPSSSYVSTIADFRLYPTSSLLDEAAEALSNEGRKSGEAAEVIRDALQVAERISNDAAPLLHAE
jgi:hypothetical protein